MFGSSFGPQRNRSKNIYDNNPAAGNSYKPNFGASFGADYRSPNNFSSSQPMSSQATGPNNFPGMFSNPSPNPAMQPMINQNPMQDQQRAMAPSMGFNSIMAPTQGNPMLRNTETGRDVDLSKNKMNPALGSLFDQFKGRIQF